MELLKNGKKRVLPASTAKASFQAVKTFVPELKHQDTDFHSKHIKLAIFTAKIQRSNSGSHSSY